MVMSVKDRLAARKAQQDDKPQSKLGALKSRLGNKDTGSSGGGSIRNKFKKRDQSVLDKTYDDRNERSKAGGMGRPIFNQDLMANYGIEDFMTTTGDRFVEVLPISFKPTVPYFREIPVHFGVGFANDAFICMHRFRGQQATSHRCYRCERQQIMWRDQQTYTKDQAKAMYPTDRACYLLWERTKELIEGESPDYTFKLWASPKSKVHSEIQEKVRDKLHRVTLDISDVNEGGDGRTVGFTIVKQGDFPDYKAFDLIPREDPIPDEVLEKLDQIIRDAEDQGFDNCIDMFFNLPEYDEVKESMATEVEEEQKPDDDSPANRRSLRPASSQSDTSDDNVKGDLAAAEEDIMNELEQLQAELEVISQNKFKWRKWCVDNDYESALDMDIVEAVPAIIDDLYEKAMADLTGDSH